MSTYSNESGSKADDFEHILTHTSNLNDVKQKKMLDAEAHLKITYKRIMSRISLFWNVVSLLSARLRLYGS